MTNRLYYGDNLDVLREHVRDETVDLIYLDPPFNSNANYNILFKSPAGKAADSQIEAFEDTWHWNDKAEGAFHDVMTSGNTDVAELLRAMRGFLKENDMMAYLAMMAVRLIELHRVLKPTGSLYLHCDPTASHYLKLLLDGVFGGDNFRNEIIWKRKAGRGETNHEAIRFGVSHDVIYFYGKSREARFVRQHRANSQAYLDSKFTHYDEAGRRYRLDNLTSPSFRANLKYEYKGYQPPEKGWAVSRETMARMDAEGRIHFPADKSKRLQRKRFFDQLEGETVDSLWDDIPPINSQAQERLGYPTQKPLALLERIIAASSNEGDVVLDPFCGCGTALHAAQKLKRQWVGIDVTHLAITLIEKRLRDNFKDSIAFVTEGRPKDLASAEELARRDKHEFQKWITTFVGGQPWRGGRKGADGGIDGLIYFDGFNAEAARTVSEKAIISVKGGANKGVGMVAELVETVGRENAAVGVLIMAALPTREMEKRAAAAGVYDLGAHGRFARIQILTLKEVFDGKRPDLPNIDRTIVGKAAKPEDTRSPRMI